MLKMSFRLFGLVFALALMPAISAKAGGIPADLVQTKIYADVASVQAGAPFKVGILFTMKPTWHVYWKNPGDAGLPTHVDFELPPGFTAGDLAFPVPQVIKEPGGLVIYGYENEVMLTSVITPSIDLKPGDDVEISSKVKWLCCNTTCVPGIARVDLKLKVGTTLEPANADLFQKWRSRLPIPAASSSSADISVKGSLVLTDPKPSAEILAKLPADRSPVVIPGAVEGMLLSVGSPQRLPDALSIPLTAKVLAGQKVTDTAISVLVSIPATPENLAETYEILIPIVAGR